MTDKGNRAFQAMYESLGDLPVEEKWKWEKIIASVAQLLAVARSAEALLSKLDHITTGEFSQGGEREEREKLRDEIEVWHTLQGDGSKTRARPCKICIMYDGSNNPYVGSCLCDKGNGWPNDSCAYWQPAVNGWDGALSVYHMQAKLLVVSAQNDQAWDEAWLVKLLELSRICKRKPRPKYSERRKTKHEDPS